jgi:hypothetical protein
MHRLRTLGPALTTCLLLLIAVNKQVSHAVRAQAGEAAHQSYLPIAMNNAAAMPYDMARFMVGDDRLYEVRHSNGSQARHQTQIEDTRFFHTKGNEIKAEWEELWATDDLIYRGTDTSPGNGHYYTLYEDSETGSAWSPRFWHVGELYERNPYVVFYRKSDCHIVASGFQRTWLRFEAYYPNFTFESGITLPHVVELSWLLKKDGEPVETYYYAENFGLVAWGSVDRGYSYINEIHQPGQRPDNTREVIPCLGRQPARLIFTPELNFGPLPPEYRAR